MNIFDKTCNKPTLFLNNFEERISKVQKVSDEIKHEVLTIIKKRTENLVHFNSLLRNIRLFNDFIDYQEGKYGKPMFFKNELRAYSKSLEGFLYVANLYSNEKMTLLLEENRSLLVEKLESRLNKNLQDKFLKIIHETLEKEGPVENQQKVINLIKKRSIMSISFEKLIEHRNTFSNFILSQNGKSWSYKNLSNALYRFLNRAELNTEEDFFAFTTKEVREINFKPTRQKWSNEDKICFLTEFFKTISSGEKWDIEKIKKFSDSKNRKGAYFINKFVTNGPIEDFVKYLIFNFGKSFLDNYTFCYNGRELILQQILDNFKKRYQEIYFKEIIEIINKKLRFKIQNKNLDDFIKEHQALYFQEFFEKIELGIDLKTKEYYLANLKEKYQILYFKKIFEISKKEFTERELQMLQREYQKFYLEKVFEINNKGLTPQTRKAKLANLRAEYASILDI